MTDLRKAAIQAVRQFGVLRYFPSEPDARELVVHLLCAMASTPEQIFWLATQMVNVVGEWQGPKEVRGIFCSHFRPADGVEMDSTHPAFNAEAGERKTLAAPPRLLLTGGEYKEPFKISPELIAKCEMPKDQQSKPKTRLQKTLGELQTIERLKEMGA